MHRQLQSRECGKQAVCNVDAVPNANRVDDEDGGGSKIDWILLELDNAMKHIMEKQSMEQEQVSMSYQMLLCMGSARLQVVMPMHHSR